MCWVNGEVLPPEQATVSVLDHGFTVGDGVFETLKIEQGTAFAERLHLQRLQRSAMGLGLTEPDLEQVSSAIGDLLGAQYHALGRLRITYTSGLGPLGSDRGAGGPTLVLVAQAAVGWPPTSRCHVSPWHRNDSSPLTGLKTTSYAENAVCLAEAKAVGADEALLGNTVGMLCEGTGSNVFVIRDGQVSTPPVTDGCLAGITRELVLAWFDVAEQSIPLAELAAVDEVFITSSTRDIHPVSAIDGRQLPPTSDSLRSMVAEFRRRSLADPDPRLP